MVSEFITRGSLACFLDATEEEQQFNVRGKFSRVLKKNSCFYVLHTHIFRGQASTVEALSFWKMTWFV